MPTAEYMRAYRKRPGVRERELRNKREYDAFHQAENRARWQRRNRKRKAAKAEWYQHSAKRIAKDRKTKRNYVAKFGPVPKRYIITVADMAKALRTGRDPFADLRAAWKAGAATRRRLRKEAGDASFTAKDEVDYTQMIKDRKLFEGACDLRWPEYFEFRQANKCARLTANDLRYAGQYTSCAVLKR
jgi:hypothetical protein